MNEHNNKMLKKHNKNISSTVTNDKIKYEKCEGFSV